jgi:integrative and conjugative element protein (TIGR02256 family)
MGSQPGNDLNLGRLGGRSATLTLSRSQRDKHLYRCGGTGTGKSKFLESLIRQDIIAWRKSKCDVLVLDPHGSLYDSLINWMSWHEIERNMDGKIADWRRGKDVFQRGMAAESKMPTLQLKELVNHSELRYESKERGAVFCLSAEVIAHFARHRQHGKIKTEIGGQLFAQFVNNEVRVVTATGPSASDKRSRFWFMPDQGRQNMEIKRLFEGGLHFVGDWHTHPEPSPRPSSLDIQSMRDCFKKSRHELKAFLMIIVGCEDFPKGLWVSLHDKTEWEQLRLVINQARN